MGHGRKVYFIVSTMDTIKYTYSKDVLLHEVKSTQVIRRPFLPRRHRRIKPVKYEKFTFILMMPNKRIMIPYNIIS